MNGRSTHGVLCALLLLLAAGVARAQEPATMDEIKELVKREVDGRRCPAIMVGILDAKGKQIIANGTTGVEGLKLDGATLFDIGMVTNIFTALMLADMAEKGEVRLEDPVSKYLPEGTKIPSRGGKEITLLDLATHTAGLPSVPGNLTPSDVNNPYVDYPAQKLYEYLASYTLTRDPGSRYLYSLIGMGLLGNALVGKGGKDFDAMLKERICVPLKMAATTAKPPAGRRAQGHDTYGKPARGWDYQGMPGVGATWSCMNDMLLFLGAAMGLDPSPLSAALARTLTLKDTGGMTTGNQFIRIGMGWHMVKQYGTDIYFQNGGGGGFAAFVGFDKKLKKGVVVLANGANGVTDIGLSILNPKYQAQEYYYKAPITDTLLLVMKSKGIEEAVKVFHTLNAEADYKYDFSEELLNTFGYELMQEKKFKEAVEIFKLNVELYPKSFNVYDSLGEAYMNLGEKELAIRNYEKSMEINPKNDNGKMMLEKLKGK